MLALIITDWGSAADIAAALFAPIGIVVSMWLSVKALREVQLDRQLRQRPHLAFETGGWRLPIEFIVAGKAIPGINPAYVERILAHLPTNAESVRLKKRVNDGKSSFYGNLKNWGAGPALLTRVTWLAEAVWIGAEKFVLDEEKKSEAVYSTEFNNMPAIPSHIASNAEAKLSRLPTFIEKDWEKKVTKVEGTLVITCRDVSSQTIDVKQQFFLFTHYLDNPPCVHVTFGDLVDKNNDASDV